jgi:hypothetical protein
MPPLAFNMTTGEFHGQMLNLTQHTPVFVGMADFLDVTKEDHKTPQDVINQGRTARTGEDGASDSSLDFLSNDCIESIMNLLPFSSLMRLAMTSPRLMRLSKNITCLWIDCSLPRSASTYLTSLTRVRELLLMPMEACWYDSHWIDFELLLQQGNQDTFPRTVTNLTVLGVLHSLVLKELPLLQALGISCQSPLGDTVEIASYVSVSELRMPCSCLVHIQGWTGTEWCESKVSEMRSLPIPLPPKSLQIVSYSGNYDGSCPALQADWRDYTNLRSLHLAVRDWDSVIHLFQLPLEVLYFDNDVAHHDSDNRYKIGEDPNPLRLNPTIKRLRLPYARISETGGIHWMDQAITIESEGLEIYEGPSLKSYPKQLHTAFLHICKIIPLPILSSNLTRLTLSFRSFSSIRLLEELLPKLPLTLRVLHIFSSDLPSGYLMWEYNDIPMQVTQFASNAVRLLNVPEGKSFSAKWHPIHTVPGWVVLVVR